jgi:hypothetical protein
VTDTPVVHLIILALAVARICRLVTTDAITESLREKVWNRFGDPGNSALGYLVTCNWCLSIYASSLVVGGYMIAEKFTIIVCTVLALSMAAGFLANRAD